VASATIMTYTYYLVAATIRVIIWWLLQLSGLLFGGCCNYGIYYLVAGATMRFIL